MRVWLPGPSPPSSDNRQASNAASTCMVALPGWSGWMRPGGCRGLHAAEQGHERRAYGQGLAAVAQAQLALAAVVAQHRLHGRQVDDGRAVDLAEAVGIQ